MKKILLMLVLLSVPVQAFAGPAVRVGGGVGWLFMPDLKEFNDQPTIDITRGGGSVNLQFLGGELMGIEGLSWGLETGFLRQYRYEFHSPILTEVTLNSYPLLAILEYGFSKNDAPAAPFFQFGAGVARNELLTELGTPQAGEVDTKDITNDLALMAGPGISFRLSDRFSVDALLQYYIVYTEKENTTRLNAAAFLGYKL